MVVGKHLRASNQRSGFAEPSFILMMMMMMLMKYSLWVKVMMDDNGDDGDDITHMAACHWSHMVQHLQIC